jgi:hypothetical protein
MANKETVAKEVDQEVAAAEIRYTWRLESWIDRGVPDVALLAKQTGYPEEFISNVCEAAGYELS